MAQLGQLATTVVGGVIGAGLGAAGGNPLLGARIGIAVGSVAGSVFFPPQGPEFESPAVKSPQFTGSQPGTPIPAVWGRDTVVAQVIDMPLELERIVTEIGGGGGKGGPSSSSQEQITWKWSAVFLLCENGLGGPIKGVRRIWADAKLIYDNRTDADLIAQYGSVEIPQSERIVASTERADDIRFYLGGTDHPAPAISVDLHGAGNTPHYYDRALMEIEGLDVTPYGNRRPTITCEVITSGTESGFPLRLTEFPTAINVQLARISTGLFTVPAATIGSPTSIETTVDVQTYDYQGVLRDTVNYVGGNINAATNVGNTNVKNFPELLYQYQNAAGSGIGTGHWFAAVFGGAESVVTGADARPFTLDLDPLEIATTQAFAYYAYPIGGAYRFGNRIYAENYNAGADTNRRGLTTYAFQTDIDVPGTEPELFFDLVTEGYFTDPSAGGVARINWNLGDDNLFYVTPNGLSAFDNGVHVLVLDESLNKIRDITLDGFPGTGGDVVVWNDRLAIANENTISIDGQIYVYDISAAAITANGGDAPELATGDHDMPLGERNLVPVGDGLFLANDGLWTLRGQITPTDPTFGEIAESIIIGAGLLAGQTNATTITDPVIGFQRDQVMADRALLDQLCAAYNVDMYDSEGQIKFKQRGGAVAVTLTEDQIGGWIDEPPASPYVRTHRQEMEQVDHMIFYYRDVNKDYQRNPGEFKRIAGNSNAKIERNLPIVSTSQFMTRAAEIRLKQRWFGRDTFDMRLQPRYGDVEPTDLVAFPSPQGQIVARVTKATDAANDVRLLELEADATFLHSSTLAGVPDNGRASQVIGARGLTNFVLFDQALLRPEDDSPGLYAAARGIFSDWVGATLQRADPNVEPVTVANFTTPAVIGYATAGIGAWDYTYIDTHTKINVSLNGDGVVSSITTDAFLAGGNAAVVGDEILSFRDVAVEIDGTRTLSTLIRGLRGTPTGGHVANERFLLLEASNMRTIAGSTADTGAIAVFNGYSAGVAAPAAQIITKTLANGRIRPYAPLNPTASRQANGDIVGKFERAQRVNPGWRAYAAPALDETTEAYEVDVVIGGTVARTIAVDNTKTFTYTAAQQGVDNAAGLDPVPMVAHMISDRVGRGRAASFGATNPLGGPTPYSQTILADGPIYYVSLNDSQKLAQLGTTAADDPLIDFGVENTNFDYNAASGVNGQNTGVLQHITGAWSFEGTVNDWPYLDLMAEEFTIVVAFKTALATAGGFVNLFDRYNYTIPSDTFGMWAIFLANGGRDDVAFRVIPDGGTFQDVVTSAAAVNDNSWHHLACVWDNKVGGSHKMYIYLDGVEAASATIVAAVGTTPSTPGSSGRKIRFGDAPETGSDAQFEGAMQDIACFDFAFDAAKVAAHFAATGF